MATNEKVESDASQKASPPGGRGVSYPAISLGEAVERARKFWEHERKNAAPLESAAAHWGYSPNSSGVRTLVAALLSYGLLSDKGSGDRRQVQLTPRALDIILDTPERSKALVDAVKSPKIYAEVMNEYGAKDLPSDHTIRSFLLRHKNFNPKAVDGFIKDFRSSLGFSGVANAVTIPADEAEDGEDKKRDPASLNVKVGDFVQCEIGGVLQFPQPRRVTEILGDGKFVTVEGSPTGLPIEGITVVTENKASVAVPVPTGGIAISGSAPSGLVQGFKQDNYTLGNEGQIILQWPEKMSAASYEEMVDWLKLQLRKIARLNEIKNPPELDKP